MESLEKIASDVRSNNVVASNLVNYKNSISPYRGVVKDFHSYDNSCDSCNSGCTGCYYDTALADKSADI